MRNGRLLTVIIVTLSIVNIFTSIPTFSLQPPLDTSMYYVGTIGQPYRLDPMRAYDTASGELLQNVYQPLIWWSDKHPITFTPGVGYNLTLPEYADLGQYEPVLCTEVPTQANGRVVVNETGSYWRFTINTNATFQSWVAANSSTMPKRAVTAVDVVYSFRRQMIYDSPYGPTWMLFKPAFDIMGWSLEAVRGPYSTYANGTFKTPENEIAAAYMIYDWCYNIGNDVYFHFQIPWAEDLLKQIFAQTWGGIVNPDWVKEYGGWDGLFIIGDSASDMSRGWSNNYHWKPTSTRSELDAYKDPVVYGWAQSSKYLSFTDSMCGTGPYTFTAWDRTWKVWRIDGDPNYWRGWDDAGDKARNYCSAVVWKAVDAWPTRKMLFLEGEFDEVNVPTDNMFDLLQGDDPFTPVEGVNLVWNLCLPANDALFFTMNVSNTSPYQSYAGYPKHLTPGLPYFFNDSHIRKAFAWAFNHTEYILEAYYGEAIQQTSWWSWGLLPADYENSSIPWRNLNFDMMQEELNQAALVEGNNISTVGFETFLCYNAGNVQRQIAAQMIAEAFATLGPQYKVKVVGLDWPLFLDAMNTMQMPAYCQGWLADFVHPDNFARAYMYSSGAFPISQGPPYPDDQWIIDAEIDAALVEPDYNVRKALYQDLQYRYWLDVISFPIVQPANRRWARDWVYGWYYNALFPGIYVYDLWKSVAYEMQPVDIDITQGIAIETWERVYWYENGTAFIGYTEGAGPPNGSRAVYNYSLIVARKDINTNVISLPAVVGLKRVDLNNSNPSTNTFYSSVQRVLLGQGDTQTVLLDMEEDGTYAAYFPGNHTFAISAVCNILYPSRAYDTDTSNNEVPLCIMKAEGPLVGDPKIDGATNILDSIFVGIDFNLNQGDPGWDAISDLFADGQINILDSIILGKEFAKTAPGPQYP